MEWAKYCGVRAAGGRAGVAWKAWQRWGYGGVEDPLGGRGFFRAHSSCLTGGIAGLPHPQNSPPTPLAA